MFDRHLNCQCALPASVHRHLLSSCCTWIATPVALPGPCSAFLSSLSLSFPHLPLVGLVDWNPAGGSQRAGPRPHLSVLLQGRHCCRHTHAALWLRCPYFHADCPHGCRQAPTSCPSTGLGATAWVSSPRTTRCPRWAGWGHAPASCGAPTPTPFRCTARHGGRGHRQRAWKPRRPLCPHPLAPLGIAGRDLLLCCPVAPKQELTARDRAQATNLAATLGQACPAWAEELRQMLGSGTKAELEALDTAECLPGLLERCILEGDCL